MEKDNWTVEFIDPDRDYKLGVAAEITGVGLTTLSNWAKSDILDVYNKRKPYGHHSQILTRGEWLIAAISKRMPLK